MAGLTQIDVAREMEWSVSKVVRIESGEVRISLTDLRALLGLYGVHDPVEVAALIEMGRMARNVGRSPLRALYPNGDFPEYVDFEASASVIRGYDSLVVPGLFQIEQYARSVIAESGGRVSYASNGASPEVIERRWQARRKRQELHQRPEPPEMVFVIDEAAVRRSVGGAEVMRRQLKALTDWLDRPHVSVRVLPFAAGAYRGMRIPFTLLEFLGGDDPVLYVEIPSGGGIEEDPEETGFYIDVFLAMEEKALAPDDSAALIAEAGRRPAR
jgi:transcriptional regulator with XRE-family HTH domain